MTLEKLYLRQIGLFEVGKFAKKPYFRGFAVVPKEPHPFAFVTSEELIAGIKAFCQSFALTPPCPTTAASCRLRALTGFRF